MVKRLGEKGQSMLEYVLILVIIIAAILLFTPAFRTALDGVYGDAKVQVETAATKLTP